MTPDGIAAKVRYGYGKAGKKLGDVHTTYRPTLPTTPALAPQNVMAFIPFISSATPEGAFKRPSNYNQPLRYGLFDAGATRVGDYIDGATGTYFVASQTALEVPMVVACNAMLSVFRGAAASTVNEDVYAGRTVATDSPVLNQFPASLLIAGRSEAGRLDLPGDSSDRGAVILLPYVAGAVLRVSDRVQAVFSEPNEISRGFTISSVELTDLGYRINARVEL